MDNEDIDPNICCMYFQSWHDDVLEGMGQSGYSSSVEDGCMKTALKMLYQTMMDFNIFVLFALTNTLCEQYYFFMLYKLPITHTHTHTNSLKIYMLVYQWKVNCM